MTFQLTINTDNAAFEDDGQELARILRELASQAEISLALYANRSVDSGHSGYIDDVNGNIVGHWTYFEPKTDLTESP